jgi:hypothetical protein
MLDWCRVALNIAYDLVKLLKVDKFINGDLRVCQKPGGVQYFVIDSLLGSIVLPKMGFKQ